MKTSRFRSHIGEHDDPVIVTYTWDGHAEIESVDRIHDEIEKFWTRRESSCAYARVTDAEWARLDEEAMADHWADHATGKLS